MRNYIYIVVLIVGFIGGFMLGQGRDVIAPTKTIVYDTIKVINPVPTIVRSKDITINIPSLTLRDTNTIVLRDTIQIVAKEESRVYQDSTYYAVVRGLAIDDYHPSLDSIQVYNKTITITEYKTMPKVRPFISVGTALNKYGLGIGGGLLFKDSHAIGLDYLRFENTNYGMIRYTYCFGKIK